MLTPLPLQLVPLLQQWLLEDLAHGDVATDLLFDRHHSPRVRASISFRTQGVPSGLWLVEPLLKCVDVGLNWEPDAKYLQLQTETHLGREPWVSGPLPLGDIVGPAPSVLKAERTLLNLLQHLSGIATLTRQFVQAVEHTPCQIVHTRKTTPGLRLLEREAVLDGGGSLHRYHLGAAAMLKDNHFAMTSLTFEEAIERVQQGLSHTQRLEVEVDRMDQLHTALRQGVKVILLDNFSVEACRQAVEVARPYGATLEASGGITLRTATHYAETGVNFLSTSQITLGAPAVDIGLDMEVLA